MSTATSSLVIGLFEKPALAGQAVAELQAAGFGKEQIGVVTRDSQALEAAQSRNEVANNVTELGVDGALVGAGIGWLLGLGVITGVVTPLGPAIVVGSLGMMLANAVGGAAFTGLVGALIGWGVPVKEAQFYDEQLADGRTVITVQADARAEEAEHILRRNGAIRYEAASEHSTSSHEE